MERMPARRLSAAWIASAHGESLDDGLSSPRAGAVSCPPLNSVRGSIVDVDYLQAARRQRLIAAAPDFCSFSGRDNWKGPAAAGSENEGGS